MGERKKIVVLLADSFMEGGQGRGGPCLHLVQLILIVSLGDNETRIDTFVLGSAADSFQPPPATTASLLVQQG